MADIFYSNFHTVKVHTIIFTNSEPQPVLMEHFFMLMSEVKSTSTCCVIYLDKLSSFRDPTVISYYYCY